MLGIFAFVFSACEDDSFDPEEARQELSKAQEEMAMNMGMMMQTPQMQSLTFLQQLTGMEFDFDLGMKSAVSSISRNPSRLAYLGMNPIFDLSRELSEVNITKDYMDGGIFEYNFATEQFDQTPANHIEFIYPADQQALNNQNNNARLVIDNLQFTTAIIDGYPEEVPSSADITMFIDNQEEMTMTFSLNVGPDGMPSGANLVMSMPPYSMNMSYAGSGNNYSLDMTMAEGNNTLVDIDLSIRIDPEWDEVEHVSGKVLLSPLEFSGSINILDMEDCYWAQDAVGCMNSAISVELMHKSQGKKIGDIEFREYYDPYWEEYVPELAIVYDDGSYDFLTDVFEIDEGDFGL